MCVFFIGLFLFIFNLSKSNFTEKNVGFSGIRTLIFIVEGEYADHHHPHCPTNETFAL